MAAPETTGRPWLALRSTLAVQTFASMALGAAPVLAPAVAPGLGLEPERVGIFIGTCYLFAMLSGLRTGAWTALHGPTRVSQLLLMVMAGGLVVSSVGFPAVFLLAAALIGAGYGAANPAAAAILGRHAPAGAPGLFFALKQAGVPLGVALAGLLMPLGLSLFGWRATAWLAAAAGVLVALALWPAARKLDPAAPGPVPRGGWGALVATLRERDVRRVSLMSFAYAMTQQGFVTFVVSLLHLERGLPLAVAAGMLAASQVLCIGVRIALGHVADRWVTPRVLLGTLGWGISLSFVALALMPPGLALPWVTLAVLAGGATAMGWNGVYFAELLRSVPRERAGAAAGGSQFFTFAGAMLGPVLFGAIVHLGGSYAFGYGCFALLGAVAGTVMLVQRRYTSPGESATVAAGQ
jgi:MFS family permease